MAILVSGLHHHPVQTNAMRHGGYCSSLSGHAVEKPRNFLFSVQCYRDFLWGRLELFLKLHLMGIFHY